MHAWIDHAGPMPADKIKKLSVEIQYSHPHYLPLQTLQFVRELINGVSTR